MTGYILSSNYSPPRYTITFRELGHNTTPRVIMVTEEQCVACTGFQRGNVKVEVDVDEGGRLKDVCPAP